MSATASAGQTLPPPPQGARPYERGAQDTVVLGCVMAVTEALRPRSGRLEFERFWLPAAMGWAQVTAHYGPALDAKAGWTVERLPEQQAGCRLRAWSNGGTPFAVALTDGAFGTEKNRVLIVATPAR